MHPDSQTYSDSQRNLIFTVVVLLAGVFLLLAVAPAGVLRYAAWIMVIAGLVGSLVLLLGGFWRGRPWGKPALPDPEEIPQPDDHAEAVAQRKIEERDHSV